MKTSSMKSYCENCKTETNQNVLSEKTNHLHEEGGWQEYHYYQIIQCCGCDKMSFRKLYTDIGMGYDVDPACSEIPYLVDLYPKRDIYDLQIKRYLNVPSNVKAIYKETIEAYNNKQLILCCAGLRAILEGICKDKSIKGIHITLKSGKKEFKSDLKGKIDGLAEHNYLTSKNADFLHNLRFIGNIALHDLSAPSRSGLRLAIDIIEHTIEDIYEIEIKANALGINLNPSKLQD